MSKTPAPNTPAKNDLQEVVQFINSTYESYKELENEAAQYALKIGLTLCKVKYILPHGQFGKWCANNLSLSRMHCWRFHRLAVEFLKQLPPDEHKKFQAWIESSSVPAVEAEDTIRAFIGGKTQMELFDEHGIGKPPNHRTGPVPHREPLQLPDGETPEHYSATNDWNRLITDLELIGLKKETWAHLTFAERSYIYDQVNELAKRLRESLKQ